MQGVGAGQASVQFLTIYWLFSYLLDSLHWGESGQGLGCSKIPSVKLSSRKVCRETVTQQGCVYYCSQLCIVLFEDVGRRKEKFWLLNFKYPVSVIREAFQTYSMEADLYTSPISIGIWLDVAYLGRGFEGRFRFECRFAGQWLPLSWRSYFFETYSATREYILQFIWERSRYCYQVSTQYYQMVQLEYDQ